jgi:hemoglobin
MNQMLSIFAMRGVRAYAMVGALCLIPVLLADPALAQVEGKSAATDGFFDALGGKSGIDQIVGKMLEIILADERINAQFKEADLPQLKAKLAEQFCALSGGPCQYSGKPMNVIHEGMHITHAQFNALAEDLQLAMAQQAIPGRIQNRLVARLAPMQRDIVGK